jgi:hypothetical protein
MTDNVTAAALASRDSNSSVPEDLSWDFVALGMLRCFQRGAELGMAGMQQQRSLTVTLPDLKEESV